jgi:hypothetical protein
MALAGFMQSLWARSMLRRFAAQCPLCVDEGSDDQVHEFNPQGDASGGRLWTAPRSFFPPLQARTSPVAARFAPAGSPGPKFQGMPFVAPSSRMSRMSQD